MRKFFILILLSLISAPLFAQMSIVFVPEVNGRNLNGIFNCTIVNVGQRATASLKITVSERKAGTVCVIRTADFDIPAGSNMLSPSVGRSASILFGNSQLARVTSQTRNFPQGDYDYCYELNFRSSDKPLTEQCFSYSLAPFADLSLIEPYDKEKICEKRPVLSWQPLLPGIPGAYYQLVLTEIKTGQSATEALNYNLPVINQKNLQATVLPYPAIAKELVPKTKYAWQVTAYKDQTILTRSDIWEFTVDCTDSVKKVVDEGGFRDLNDLTNGNYYLAKGFLKFAFTNAYAPQDLQYEIIGGDKLDKKLKRLPKIKVNNGLNTITIDLTEISGIKDKHYYILNVTLPDGSLKSLRFYYNDPKE